MKPEYWSTLIKHVQHESSLVAVLNAEDGFNKLADLSNTIQILVGSTDLFFNSVSGTQSSAISSLLFDKYPAALNTSTLGESVRERRRRKFRLLASKGGSEVERKSV